MFTVDIPLITKKPEQYSNLSLLRDNQAVRCSWWDVLMPIPTETYFTVHSAANTDGERVRERMSIHIEFQ